MLLMAVSSVAACSVSTPSAKAPISLPELPARFACTVEDKDCIPACPYAAKLPDRDIKQVEAETYWRQDRGSLKTCRESYGAVVRYYENLRTKLSSPES